MKKTLILLVSVILVTGLFISCKNEPAYDSLKGTWTYESFDAERGGMKTVIEFDGLGKFVMSEWNSLTPFPYVMSGTYSFDSGYLVLSDSSLDIPSRHTETYPAVMFKSPDDEPDEDEDSHVWLMFTDNDEGPYVFDEKPKTADWENYTVNEKGKQFIHGSLDDHAYIYYINNAEDPTEVVFLELQVFTGDSDEEVIYRVDIEWKATAVSNENYDPAKGIHFLKYYDETYTGVKITSKARQDKDKLYMYRGEKEIEFTR